MRNYIIATAVTALLTALPAAAQNGGGFSQQRGGVNQQQGGFNQSRSGVGGNSSGFSQNRASNFSDYRQQLNAQYISLTRERWQNFDSYRAQTPPDRDEKPVAPIQMSEDDAKKERQDRQVVIDAVVTPKRDNERAQPVAPVQETPDETALLEFKYLGNPLSVRRPKNATFRLSGVSENAVADAWEVLCQKQWNNLVVDCIKLRGQKQLCDWAYLCMLRDMSAALCGSGTNEATLLMAFVYSQSGYKIRLGDAGGRLEMLYATKHIIYNRSYFNFDGEQFYTFNKEVKQIRINAAKYPKEQSLSLWVPQTPQSGWQSSTQRTLTSKRYPEMSVHVTCNKLLLPFYESYPTSEVGGNFMTRWAMYANTPISDKTRTELYPQLQQALGGMSQQQQVERLLNWVQTAFVYEYDDKVWGGDRAFFPDETLYYPYCDCEDRSILFTRLVRDIVGLKCILVYYPGHLASAVCFTDQVNGDYIQTGGRRYVVCDPTYIGAPVGSTMPKMDNASAKVIQLD